MQTNAIEPGDTKQMPVDFLPLQGTDYVEFYVGNAKQAAHFYKTAFGFQSLAYAGPETGVKDKASYVIRQNKLTFILTTPVRANNGNATSATNHHHLPAHAINDMVANSATQNITSTAHEAHCLSG